MLCYDGTGGSLSGVGSHCVPGSLLSYNKRVILVVKNKSHLIRPVCCFRAGSGSKTRQQLEELFSLCALYYTWISGLTSVMLLSLSSAACWDISL